MSKKKLSFQQFRVTGVGEVLPKLERCLRQHHIDFYLLGGLARNINLMRKGVQPQRVTKDIDIAVLVPRAEKFEKLLDWLEKEEGFRRSSSDPLAIYLKDVKVDILPFNQFIAVEGAEKALGPAFADFNLQGLHEVYLTSTEEVELEKDHRFRVITIEAIILLKLLAYHDKPEWRLKDLEDIAELIQHYFDLNDEEIYQQHNDLFVSGKELTAIACRVIGRKMGSILKNNKNLKSQVNRILKEHLKKGSNSRLILALINSASITAETGISQLREILTGLEEGI